MKKRHALGMDHGKITQIFVILRMKWRVFHRVLIVQSFLPLGFSLQEIAKVAPIPFQNDTGLRSGSL